MARGEDNVLTNIRPKLWGLKKFVHGTNYQLKMFIYFYIVNAKKLANPSENSNTIHYIVNSEDKSVGNFDDIQYILTVGEKEIKFYIQAKHSYDKVDLTLKDLSNKGDKYCINIYFESFQTKSKLQNRDTLLILCTNRDTDEKLKSLNIFTNIASAESEAEGDTTSLDFHILTLFMHLGGQLYRLNYQNLKTYGSIYIPMKNSADKQMQTERKKLVELIVNAIESGPNFCKITSNHELAMKYRSAIMSAIVQEHSTANESCRFTEKFLNCSIPKLGYIAFKNEFEIQYKKKFEPVGDLWDELKKKKVFVAEDFWLDEKNIYPSTDSFPDGEESIKTFCEEFRLYCGTKSEDEFMEIISNLLIDLFPDENCTKEEINMVAADIFQKAVDWMAKAESKAKTNEDFRKDLERYRCIMKYAQLACLSKSFCENIGLSSFRIKPASLNRWYNGQEMTFLTQVTSDAKYIISLFSDISNIKKKDTLVFESSVFHHYSKTIQEIFEYNDDIVFLIVVCSDKLDTITDKIQWHSSNRKTTKYVILINKVDTDGGTPFTHLPFCLKDLTEKSYQLLLETKFNHVNHSTWAGLGKDVRIEEVIKLFEWLSKMDNENEIVKDHNEIKNNFIRRYCTYTTDENSQEHAQKSFSDGLEELSPILLNILDFSEEFIGIENLSKRINENRTIRHIFNQQNQNTVRQSDSQNCQDVPTSNKKDQKVFILLGDAGSGKSTYLTWLAWHLQETDKSSLVVRCNLSDYCTKFSNIMRNEMIVNDTEALRMLYKLLDKRSDLNSVVQCLVFNNGAAQLNSDKFSTQTLQHQILLLMFTEKFNSHELVLLFDGFDEITPRPQEFVLRLLTVFSQFKGVKKLYLSSRAYNFKTTIETAFKDPLFFQLKPLSLQDKGSMLYNMMNTEERKSLAKIDDKEIGNDFRKVLTVIIMFALKDLSNNSLNLKLSEAITYHVFEEYVQHDTKKLNKCFFADVGRRLKPSIIVDEFVTSRIQRYFSKIDDSIVFATKAEHGIVALRVYVDKNERKLILSPSEKHDELRILKDIWKFGIINDTKPDNPKFAHKMFADFSVAWWTVYKRLDNKLEERPPNTNKLLTILSKNIDIIPFVDRCLADNAKNTVGLAIIDNDLQNAKALLDENPKRFGEIDKWGRTPFHYLALFTNFGNYREFLPLLLSCDREKINTKEQLFGRTPLDCAFQANNRHLILYLLYHGASVNVIELYNQVVSAEKVDMRKAAIYAKYVMEFSSQNTSTYESTDVECGNMKTFCDKVAQHLVSNTSDIIDKTENTIKKKNLSDILKTIIHVDSVWMLESMEKALSGQEQRKTFQTISQSFYNWATEAKSIFVMKYVGQNPFGHDEHDFITNFNMDYLIKIVALNYKNEFKWLIDLWFKPRNIQRKIQNDDTKHPTFLSWDDKDVEVIVDKVKTTISAMKQHQQQILSLCLVCGRPSMLGYFTESLELNLSVAEFNNLVNNTHKVIVSLISSKLARKKDVQLGYGLLFGMLPANNGYDANHMLLSAIDENLAVFCEYLIDMHAFERNQIFTFFESYASRPGTNDKHIEKSMLKLFPDMLIKTGMNCFDNLDEIIFQENEIKSHNRAIEKDLDNNVKFIVTKQLGINDWDKIKTLDVKYIPDLKKCCLGVYNMAYSSQFVSCKMKECCHEVLCSLVDQFAYLLLSINEATFQDDDKTRFIMLHEEAKKLYQIAMKCRSLPLMYYLHRETSLDTQSSSSDMEDDSDWLACIRDTFYSRNSVFFKWAVAQYCHRHGIECKKKI